MGQQIQTISDTKIPFQGNAVRIDATGFTLMPGLIESHGHLAHVASLEQLKYQLDWSDIGVRQAAIAKSWLLDGFTTIRDVGGPTLGLKRTIDAGIVPGPRIYSSGAIITPTAGIEDYQSVNARTRNMTFANDREHLESLGYYSRVDGVAQILTATRNNLGSGVSQIKIMAGASANDGKAPAARLPFRPEEIKAAVNVATDSGTYASAHVYYPVQINQFIEAGGMSIEHARAIDNPTMKKVVNKGVFVSVPLRALSKDNSDGDNSDQQNLLQLVQKHNPKMVFATDAKGSVDNQARQRRQELFERARLLGNFATLKSATSVAGELMQLSEHRNPYKLGKLGVIEQGAYADLLVVAGNPLADISLLGARKSWKNKESPEPIDTIKVIIKDGKIVKNIVRRRNQAN
ncbi:amidohydrolase family protein [Thalassotalea mangrovi]|uniref:amidohydrolase family protein n=1 Tax=Thalassotalea mangrovi TaxID=2572245 RepID=UPI00145F9B92|nr:amidohydrolase family protein [Thalassotalea mangrovi]